MYLKILYYHVNRLMSNAKLDLKRLGGPVLRYASNNTENWYCVLKNINGTLAKTKNLTQAQIAVGDPSVPNKQVSS